MTRSLTTLVVLGTCALLSAQGKDASQILDNARAALGGAALESVKTIAGKGRTLRTGPAGETLETEFEVAFAQPDKYRFRAALMPMGNMTIYRETGFNGDLPIEHIDRPPNLSGGLVHIRVAGPGGPVDPAKMTPEQKAEFDRQRVLSNKKEFARLALGLFAGGLPAFPLEFSYAGEAESPDGKADVLDVKGPDSFSARLFLDAATHLPLMLSWMDKEPLIMRKTQEGGTSSVGPGGAVMQKIQRDTPMSKEERDRIEQDFEAARAETEAKRRTVEYRLFYADFRQVEGVLLPHRIQRSIDGKTTEEMEFDSLKVNAKIDPRTFEPSK